MPNIRIFYQYDATRLSACPLTIHILLHIADGIEKIGPMWVYWCFALERHCGLLQRMVTSRSRPYESLS
ncbi:hypothetical protein BOTBODRAFT_109517 [Botryobasidium botryosum FD-172 SS1]|uniref:Uncharacterized protein n=1 Tax=Botryobasidium botryosum (strain FD-172 SS1) TaxID=930990 RepID=A0A067MTH7_BOTB1|nr:hypothetical protein BOTBODRAFT_109517 [Botryobasidium botryosum FD-172 SS1]